MVNTYPATLPLGLLEKTNQEYDELIEVWKTIRELYEGGYVMAKARYKYLPQRSGEEDFIYETRLNKFTYTNIIGTVVNRQVSKFKSGSIAINNIDRDPLWAEIRESLDGENTDEKDYIGKLYRDSILYGRAYAHVDKPRVQVPPKNKAQEKALKIRPYVVNYSVFDTIDWSVENNHVEFLKIRQQDKFQPNPFADKIDRITWTFITAKAVVKYQALVKLDKKGNISSVLNTPDREGSDATEETKIPLLDSVEHGMGKTPCLLLKQSSELWTGNQAYLKAIEHLNLENTVFDAASLATYIQRVYKPFRAVEDLGSTFEEPSPTEQLLSGNPYVLEADSFSFEEMQGTAIAIVTALLEKIKEQVAESLSLNPVNAQTTAYQSAEAKKLDLYREELILRAYGQTICTFYQDIIQLIAQALGSTDLEQYSVIGLDNFELDAEEIGIELIEKLIAIRQFLPETVLKLFMKQLSKLLVKNASAEEQNQIDKELEQIDFHQESSEEKAAAIAQKALAVKSETVEPGKENNNKIPGSKKSDVRAKTPKEPKAS